MPSGLPKIRPSGCSPDAAFARPEMYEALETDSRAVVRFYNQRGTAEQWIKKGRQAVKMTRLSCHRFRSNEVRLWLSAIAYNLGNLWRRLFGSMVRRIAAVPLLTG